MGDEDLAQTLFSSMDKKQLQQPAEQWKRLKPDNFKLLDDEELISCSMLITSHGNSIGFKEIKLPAEHPMFDNRLKRYFNEGRGTVPLLEKEGFPLIVIKMPFNRTNQKPG